MAVFGFKFNKRRLSLCLEILQGRDNLNNWDNDELSELGYEPYNFRGLGTPSKSEARRKAAAYIGDCIEYLFEKVEPDESCRISEGV